MNNLGDYMSYPSFNLTIMIFLLRHKRILRFFGRMDPLNIYTSSKTHYFELEFRFDYHYNNIQKLMWKYLVRISLSLSY